MDYNVKGRILHRRFCRDFRRWTEPVWSRANKQLRTKLRNVLETHDIFFNANVHLALEKLAELLNKDKGPRKQVTQALRQDHHRLRHQLLHLLLLSADSEDPSADRQENEDILSEEFASARPKLVPPYKEKPSSDQPAADRDVSVATCHNVQSEPYGFTRDR
ncbi:hypothetical protein E4U37_000788 [Claviceps purpurea]|nr:hypothetical protein E4U37_000788 [Claviceps purpurea]